MKELKISKNGHIICERPIYVGIYMNRAHISNYVTINPGKGTTCMLLIELYVCKYYKYLYSYYVCS